MFLAVAIKFDNLPGTRIVIGYLFNDDDVSMTNLFSPDVSNQIEVLCNFYQLM